MQIANVLVALGGDRGNSVPKTVTPGEIAMLQAIHGADSVHDIEPAGTIDRSNANELARLRQAYGGERDEDGKSVIANVYPGAGAQVPTTLKSLGLAAELYKAKTRARPDDVEVATPTGSLAYKEEGGNTGFEPIEVPADPETSDLPDETGMQDPRLQPQVDLPPGLATATKADVKDAIVDKVGALETARAKPTSAAKKSSVLD